MLRKANYTIDVQEIFNQKHRSHVFKYQALWKTFTAESFFQRSFPGVLFLLLESPLGLWHLGEHSPEISFFHRAQPQACCGKQLMTDLNKHATKMHAWKRRQGNVSSSWFLAGPWRSSVLCLLPAGRVGLGTLGLRGLEASSCGHEYFLVFWPLDLCWWAPLPALTVFMGI